MTQIKATANVKQAPEFSKIRGTQSFVGSCGPPFAFSLSHIKYHAMNRNEIRSRVKPYSVDKPLDDNALEVNPVPNLPKALQWGIVPFTTTLPHGTPLLPGLT